MKTFRNIVFGLVLGFGATVFAQGTIFPDVQLSDWFTPYVNEIKDWGVVSGNDDGTFAPARNINRAEFSKMLVLYDERVDEKIDGALENLPQNDVTDSPASVLPSVMQLEIKNGAPADCPADWTEAGMHPVYEFNDDNQRRTCVTDQRCEVFYFEARLKAPDCPAGWDTAAASQINTKNWQSVCYVCAE